MRIPTVILSLALLTSVSTIGTAGVVERYRSNLRFHTFWTEKVERKDGTLELWNRKGGYIHMHMEDARKWLKQGRKIAVRGEQMSAAAIQVVWLAKRTKRICAMPGAYLYFHAGTNTRTGQKTDTNKEVLGYSIKTGWYKATKFIRAC